MMQLPRGTFREIKRSVAIEDLLDELNREKYSGVASISSSSLNGTLVFKAGECILVTFRNSRGDTAWDEIRSAGSEEVDAALSLLGDAQIDLALEFNKACRIQKPAARHAAAPAARRAAPVHHGSSRTAPAPAAAPQKPGAGPAAAHRPLPVPHAAPDARATRPAPPAPAPLLHQPRVTGSAVQVPPSPPVPSPRPEPVNLAGADEQNEKNPDTVSFESELDTFDTMDIDTVTDKIRTDCRTMIKQLHLDHLMER